jgi:hypothetical protein
MKSYKSIDNNEKAMLIGSNDIEDVLEVDTQGQYIDDSSEGFLKILKFITVFIVVAAFIMIVNKEDKGIMTGNGYVTMTQTLDKSSFKITIYVDSPTYKKVDLKDFEYDVYVQPHEKTAISVKKFQIDDVDVRNFEHKYDISWYANNTLIAVGNDIDYKFEDEGFYDASVSLTELSSSTSNTKISSSDKEESDSNEDDDFFKYDFTLAVQKYSRSKSKSLKN